MKLEILGNMSGLSEQIRQKLNVLTALDQDTTTTGSHDLHDQLMTFVKTLDALDGVLERSVKISGG